MTATTIIDAYYVSPTFGHPTAGTYMMTVPGHSINLPDTTAEPVQMRLSNRCRVIDTDYGPAIMLDGDDFGMDLHTATKLGLARRA